MKGQMTLGEDFFAKRKHQHASTKLRTILADRVGWK